MNASFDAALAFTFQWEGSYSNDPRDPGGATNHGITLKTLADWRGTACTPADVQALTQDEAGAIYRARYWDAVQGDSLAPGVDLMVFDHAVNAGPGRSARLLQGAVSTTMDGMIGPATLAAASAVDPTVLVDRLAAAQEVSYRATPNFDVYGRGWLNRLAARKAAALEMIG